MCLPHPKDGLVTPNTQVATPFFNLFGGHPFKMNYQAHEWSLPYLSFEFGSSQLEPVLVLSGFASMDVALKMTEYCSV